MKIEEIQLEYKEVKIYAGHCKPSQTNAVTILVHGFGEHSGRYIGTVIPALLESESAVVFYDNIGHGKTIGKRGHCENYESLLEVLDRIIAKARVLYPNIPLFLYGHSMGGNLVLNYALKQANGIDGVIATSPYLRLAFNPPKWKIILGKLMLKIAPSITLSSGLEPSGISRVPEEVAKYRLDSLIHDKVSPMYSFPIIDAGEWAITNAAKLKVRTLLLHGTGDAIIDYKGTEEFHLNSSNTTLKLFEGGFHELHHDSCADSMLKTIQNWLRQQL